MKKLLSLALCLVLMLSVLPGMGIAQAEEDLVILKVMGYERGLENNYFVDRDQYPVWQKAEEMFHANGVGFEFEIIADADQYKTIVQTRLASQHDLPDLCYVGTMSDTDVLAQAEMGTLLSMNEILETTKGHAYAYFFGGEGETARNLITDESGSFYWLPRIQMNQLDGVMSGTSMGMTIRSDWLDKVGLAVPQSLEEFTAALTAFQEQDVNGNGIKDEVLDADTSKFENGISLWFGMVTGYVGVNITEQKVESPWHSPYVREYFTYIQSLNEQGLLYSDAIGSDASRDQVRNENRLAGGYYYPIGSYWENPLIASGVEGVQYIGITPFAAVEGVNPFYSEETPYLVYLKHAVTKTAEDKKEAVAKVYDTIYSPDFIHLMDWGIEGLTYTEADGVKTSLVRGKSFAQNAADKSSMPDYLWRHFFPNIFHNERRGEIESTIAAGWPDKAEYEESVNNWPYKTPNDNSGYYALPTAEQSERLDALLTDLETASREAAADLSLGNRSVDEIEDIVAELVEMGLDEVIEIRQEQLNRRFGK